MTVSDIILNNGEDQQKSCTTSLLLRLRLEPMLPPLVLVVEPHYNVQLLAVGLIGCKGADAYWAGDAGK